MKIKSITITVVSLAAVFLVGVLAFNYVIMPMLINQHGSVIVPELRNLSEKQANKELERCSLNIRVLRREHNGEIPSGYVISQHPRANESIKEGRTIEVVVSAGARSQVVPELEGLSLRQGRIMLGRKNLRIGRVARIHTTGEARETILATTPGAGEELVEGMAVDIAVSVGGKKQSYLMPDLTGQDLLFIRDELRSAGFRVGGVRYEPHPDVFPNTIVGQTPVPGALIRQGDSIELVAASSD